MRSSDKIVFRTAVHIFLIGSAQFNSFITLSLPVLISEFSNQFYFFSTCKILRQSKIVVVSIVVLFVAVVAVVVVALLETIDESAVIVKVNFVEGTKPLQRTSTQLKLHMNATGGRCN